MYNGKAVLAAVRANSAAYYATNSWAWIEIKAKPFI
jgi:hypothetical protein